MYPPFLASEFQPVAPKDAYFHFIPAPLEHSVSYGHGTALGPSAILKASQQLEAWDGVSSPGDLGFFTHAPVDCTGDTQQILERIEHATTAALEHDAMPILLGGEHTVSLGALRAVTKHYGMGNVGIVQFDAHADLRAIYEGSPLSHACVMHRAVADLHMPLAQFGVRDWSREEASVRQQYKVTCHDASCLHQGLPDQPLPEGFPQQIYITFDVDAFDASVMPATGTPVPGGLDWYTSLTLIERCIRGRQVVGLDVVELAPIAGLHFADYTAARLTYFVLGLIQRNTASGITHRR